MQHSDGFTRRRFLSGSSLLVSGALLGADQDANAQRASAPARNTVTRVIDVHHHFVPPFYFKAQDGYMTDRPELRTWAPERSLEKMDRDGIATAMLSISNPGVEDPRNPANTTRLCRQCNDTGAKIVADRPMRFGHFASLPLPDVAASLKELEYAMDSLHADGIVLMSHYGDARYLADPAFAPVFEEMNRRKVVVFIHPRSPFYAPPGTAAVGRNPIDKAEGAGIGELPFDTTRAIANMRAMGTTEKYPNIRFIAPHAGGVMLLLLTRAVQGQPGVKQNFEKIRKFMSAFYYDMTNSVSTMAVRAVLDVAPASKIVFGSDFPFVINEETTRVMLAELSNVGLAEPDRIGVGRRNAEALFPRLKQSS